jgi:hypothetical protein
MNQLSDFTNIHEGRRCFVIGNGPSLNRIDMSLLRSQITFGSNRVYQGFDKWGFGFTYWSIEDQLVAEDIAEEWTGEMIANPRYRSTVFVPEDLMHHVDAHVKTSENPCIPINFSRVEYYPNLYPFSTDPKVIVWGGTVTYLLLQLAALMGCNPIVLLGIDFNYSIPNTVRELGASRLMSTEDDPNHFFPGYFGKGRRWHDPNLPRMRIAYLSAEKASHNLGFRIYNATPRTKLKVFTRIDFNRSLDGYYYPSTVYGELEKRFSNINFEKRCRQAATLARLVRWR